MGRATVAGGNPAMSVPSAGVKASELAVGSSVYRLENGVPVEFLVVNQGKPSGSSLYDDSCNGVWLLRKLVTDSSMWASGKDYASSNVNTDLNQKYLSRFTANTREQIKTAKIPYFVGVLNSGSVASGENGVSAKVFLLSACEVGRTPSQAGNGIPADGASVSYFANTATKDEKRIAYYDDGLAKIWWLRTPLTNSVNGSSVNAWHVNADGGLSTANKSQFYALRPALILPSDATFDEKTMILKEVG